MAGWLACLQGTRTDERRCRLCSSVPVASPNPYPNTQRGRDTTRLLCVPAPPRHAHDRLYHTTGVSCVVAGFTCASTSCGLSTRRCPVAAVVPARITFAPSNRSVAVLAVRFICACACVYRANSPGRRVCVCILSSRVCICLLLQHCTKSSVPGSEVRF
jgi:hypothetical protein